AYTDAELRVTANLQQSYFSSDHPVATGFTFDSYNGSRSNRVFQKIDAIDDQGKATHKFKLEKQNIVFGRLNVESAVRDDRGKFIASSSSADFLAVDRLVGLKQTKWVYEQDELSRLQYIVVDPSGSPVAGTKVDIKIERQETKSSKVKGAGNAYITEYVNEWVDAGNCSGASKPEISNCEFTPEKPGSYRMVATIKDTKGTAHTTSSWAWVVGKGQVVWEQPNDNSLQIIPEATEYAIGDTARYLVKNPYPGAQALVTVERYGALKSWVQILDGSTPVIEFDIEKDFMPGFYFSVTVVSPRVAAPLPKQGEVDLGKPTFKTGYVEVPVNDPYKQMLVTAKADQDVYRPRDTVKISLHAEPKTKDKTESIELAVVVLDEAVLDLVQGGANYFDPYKGFYKLDGLDLRNFSLLTRLIGRQRFEKKGANAGGDGGADISMRSLFKYVSYWNPSIIPNADGDAEISFEIPDNLTGWRVLAFAVTPSDRMGLGQGKFKVNRPTEVRPVMPNQVTEGDTFKAGFSVMNRTDQPRKINVEVLASGTLKAGQACRAANDNTKDTVCSYSKIVDLPPYKRETVYMPMAAGLVPQSRAIRAGHIQFEVRANDAVDGDGMEHTLTVNKRRSLDTAANYGSTTESLATESLLFPDRIHPDVGDVSVVLSPSVIGNIDGAFRYMRDYDYAGWEAKLSQAVMASHYQNLEDYMPEDLTWAASEKLPQQALDQAANYQAPNGGMVYFIAQDKYVSPYLSAYTALSFNWLRDSGNNVPAPVEAKLHAYLDRLLRKDLVPTFYSRGMSSSVRAVALAALAEHDKIKLSDLQRYRDDVQYMDLFGQAHYLQAALKIDGAGEIVTEVSSRILASSVQSGGKFSFNETLDDSYSRILATPLRANCAILSSFTEQSGMPGDVAMVGDIPFKLVRTITQSRGKRDHWENTQENVFCMNGLVDYARKYENQAPNLQVRVAIDDSEIGRTSFAALTDEAVTISREITPSVVGQKQTVQVERFGTGRLYHATRMSYAPLDDSAERANAGIDIRKEYHVERNDKWELLKNPAEIKRGELVRVDIFVSLPTARNFVVVDDPIPGGLEPINRDLATSSSVDADKGEFKASGGSWWFQFDDWAHYSVSRWSFYHKELRHDAARFYSDYLPAGNYILSYTAQAIAEGEFTKMPVHSEEMYDPDIYGKGLPGILKVSADTTE
ncbi:MAG: large extracellular alpha-helical protein, partial [Acidimicrobiales bacterium]